MNLRLGRGSTDLLSRSLDLKDDLGFMGPSSSKSD